MRFETSQQMKLGQHMKLAPRMIQSMEILQLALPALEERIEQELSSNIALEIVEPSGNEEGMDSRDDGSDHSEGELVITDDGQGQQDDFARLDSMETNYGEAFDNEYSSNDFRRDGWESGDWTKRAGSRLAGERDKKMDAMANAEARPAALVDQLAEQWQLNELEGRKHTIGELIISFIDEDGYLRTELETIVDRTPALEGEPVTVEELEEGLRVVQEFLDPPGLAARDTIECLLLQLDSLELNDQDGEADFDLVREIIRKHLDDLVQNRLPKVAQQTGREVDDIKEAMQFMHRLSLSPGRALVSSRPPRVIPDAIIEFDEEQDAYVAGLCDGVLPALRVSQVYETMGKDKSVDKETREFIGTNLRNARWLVEAIDQRNNTLMRVIRVVVEAQRDFFDSGPQYLKPLPMTQVADQLGVHVATVSRAVSDKWVQTPRGVLPLRQFFSGGTETQDGTDKSWDAIKAILKEVIEVENKSKPLSDDALAAELKKQGIDIARRTVAKYRDQLGIPPARRRREY